MKHVTPEMVKTASADSWFLLYYRNCESSTDVLIGRMSDFWFFGMVWRYESRNNKFFNFPVGYRLAPGDTYPKNMFMLSDEEALLHVVCEEL